MVEVNESTTDTDFARQGTGYAWEFNISELGSLWPMASLGHGLIIERAEFVYCIKYYQNMVEH